VINKWVTKTKTNARALVNALEREIHHGHGLNYTRASEPGKVGMGWRAKGVSARVGFGSSQRAHARVLLAHAPPLSARLVSFPSLLLFLLLPFVYAHTRALSLSRARALALARL